MIVRTWMAYAKPENAGSYRDHLEGSVVPGLRKLPGFLGLSLCQAPRGDRVELMVISRWQSMDAIRAFAGAKADRAVIEPRAQAMLAEFDDFVSHYEVTLDTAGAA